MQFLKVITKITKNLKQNPVDTRILGRWSMGHDEKKIGHRIDNANEDHCGVCSQMREQYIEQKNKNIKIAK
tara:strand:- start:604 stop:816 length:213 start_codon:yes stop_codon:yes gene_type:complete